MLKTLARYAPLMGVLGVVLWVIGAALLWSGAPDDDATGAQIATYFDEKSTRILLATTVFGVGSAAFIWFLDSLARRLRMAEGEGRLASVAMAAGTAAATLFTLLPGTFAAGALAYENLDRTLSPEAAETLFVLGDGFFIAAEFVAVAFLGAAAVSMLRSRALPTWYGVVTAILAIALIVGPIGWAVLLFGIPVWTLVTSVWLFAGDRRTPVPQPPM